MPPEEKITFCRICEAWCGLVATVEDGRLVRLRPDRDHPLSAGFACPKGIAMTDVQNDPDRVLHPLRRTPAGGFEQVTWDDALDDISRRLRRALEEHGPGSVGWYFGNPTAFSYSHAAWLQGFVQALGITHLYSAGSQDVNNRFVASKLLYGRMTTVPIPDLARTDLLLVIGANPLVSHGSLISAPRIREQLHAITDRGGRVVVVDPRRTETAAAFEHLPVVPDGDAWLLMSLLHVLFDEGLEDRAALARQSTGVDLLRAAAAAYPPEATARLTGVEPETVRSLARDLAAAPAAAVYGRTGSCLGRQGTLVAALIDALSLITGNLDRAGGAVFGRSPIPAEELGERVGVLGYDRRRSRVGGFPDVLGSFPAAVMAKEMTTPGAGRLRTLFVSAGNPVLSVPNGAELEAALGGLDLLVSLDLYVNETNRHADYVLPSTTWLERDDLPVASLTLHNRPFIQYTDAVVPAYGEAREEWQVIDELLLRTGVTPFVPRRLRLLGGPAARVLRRLPRPTPRTLIDLALRSGPAGDRFGLRRDGLSIARLRRHPHGIVLAEHCATGVLPEVVGSRDGRVRLDHPLLRAELDRLAERTTEAADPAYPLRLIGMRELRSQNSWMHNSPTLMKGRREHLARIHPKDAADAGLADGQVARITSPHGRIEIPVQLTEDLLQGTVAVPHGWGHRGGGWRRANEAGGVNVNALASTDPAELELLAGMAHLNGIPVRLEPAERD